MEAQHTDKLESTIALCSSYRALGGSYGCAGFKDKVHEAFFVSDTRLKAIAADPIARQAVTALLASEKNPVSGCYGGEEVCPPAGTDPTRWARVRWLNTLKLAGKPKLQEAGMVAWLAYESGEFAEASAWVELAPRQDVYALIARSQLALRAGQKRQAATFLEQAVSAKSPHYLWHTYGNLLVETGSYAKATQAFLEGWAWLDAAWVAEHLLSTEELIKLVPKLAIHTPEPEFTENMPSDAPEAMAYLLARRLAREERWEEAVKWYPPAIQGEAQKALELTRKIAASTGRDRAAARFALAQILRHFGMELIGTEAGPDFYLFGGEFAYGDITSGILTKPSLPAEARMKILASIGPTQRFHYRYTAAELAWKAAAELPDEDPLLIQALCVGGSWLKHRDPPAAERFYHALVIRGRPDPIARVADGRRWFPESDGYSCKALPWPPPVPYSYPPATLQMAQMQLEEERDARRVEQQHRWMGRGVAFMLGGIASGLLPTLWKNGLKAPLIRAGLVGLVIAGGLGSRIYYYDIPLPIAENAGDMLYASLIVLLMGAVLSRPVLPALLFCVLIELSQLVHTPILDAIRQTAIGKLVLGQGFVWEDLVRYGAGVLLGGALEWLQSRFLSRKKA